MTANWNLTSLVMACAIETPAASLPPDELNRVGFRLYERLRPDVPTGAEGEQRAIYGLSGSNPQGPSGLLRK